MEFFVVIPARYASTRLPGKPLQDIAGLPMVVHVYRRAVESGAKQVLVATDDERVREAVERFGGQAMMTSTQHRSGTERLAEVADYLSLADDSIVVNLQGDEPMMPAALLRQVAKALHDHPAEVSTLCAPFLNVEDLFDPNIVKLVRDIQGYALYFSRAPIPWNRATFTSSPTKGLTSFHQRHIGLYAYRAGFIRKYVTLLPSPIEELESLEQLRILYHGFRIYLEEAIAAPGPGVDTPEDLDRVRQLF